MEGGGQSCRGEPMSYPKFKYFKADNEEGFEAVLLSSKEEEARLKEPGVDSPAELGIETHPSEPPPVDERAKFFAEEPARKRRRSA